MAEKYRDVVEASAKTRAKIDLEMWPAFDALKAIFETFVPYKGKHFKLLSDHGYYQGGYPNESSLSRDEELAISVAALLGMQQLVGGNLRSELKKLGVSVTFKPLKLDKRPIAKAKELRKAGISRPGMNTPARYLAVMLERAQEVQGEICAASDSIKIDAAAQVKRKFKIEKPGFMTAVAIRALTVKKKPAQATRKARKALDMLDNQLDAVTPVTETMFKAKQNHG